MKIFGFIIVFCGATAVMPTHASIRQCMNMSTDVAACGITSGLNVDWQLNCSGFSYRGVGMCSTKEGTTRGELYNGDLPRSNETYTVYCWCKMLNPGVSSWVFCDSFTLYAACVQSCATRCEQMLKSWADQETILRNMLQSAITLD